MVGIIMVIVKIGFYHIKQGNTMSNREGKNKYKKFMGTRRNQLCPKCLKGHLQPCRCGCKNVGKHVLECNVCNFVNY